MRCTAAPSAAHGRTWKGQDGNYKQFTVSDGSDNPYPGMEIGYFECTNMNEYERWNLRNRPPPPAPPPDPDRDWRCSDYNTYVDAVPDVCEPQVPSDATDWDRTDDSCADSAFTVRLPDASVATIQPEELTTEAECAQYHFFRPTGTDYQIRGDLTDPATRTGADAYPWAQGNGCSYLPYIVISGSQPGQVLWQQQSGRVGFDATSMARTGGTAGDRSMKAAVQVSGASWSGSGSRRAPDVASRTRCHRRCRPARRLARASAAPGRAARRATRSTWALSCGCRTSRPLKAPGGASTSAARPRRRPALHLPAPRSLAAGPLAPPVPSLRIFHPKRKLRLDSIVGLGTEMQPSPPPAPPPASPPPSGRAVGRRRAPRTVAATAAPLARRPPTRAPSPPW